MVKSRVQKMWSNVQTKTVKCLPIPSHSRKRLKLDWYRVCEDTDRWQAQNCADLCN